MNLEGKIIQVIEPESAWFGLLAVVEECRNRLVFVVSTSTCGGGVQRLVFKEYEVIQVGEPHLKYKPPSDGGWEFRK